MKTKEIPPVDEFEGQIGKSFEILRRTAKLVKETRDVSTFPIVLAGNCMSTVSINAAFGDVKELGCVCFDVRDDFATPSTTISGYLDGCGVAIMAC